MLDANLPPAVRVSGSPFAKKPSVETFPISRFSLEHMKNSTDATLKGTILLGCPDKDAQSVLSEFIERNLDQRVLCVSETSDLLLEVLDKQVCLTIIDINLKGLPITKTIQIVKKCRPRVPVVVLSDDYSVATGSRIMEHGVFYYMYKPLDMESFKEIVISALKKHAREESLERR